MNERLRPDMDAAKGCLRQEQAAEKLVVVLPARIEKRIANRERIVIRRGFVADLARLPEAASRGWKIRFREGWGASNPQVV
jgi:hypothetical protein